jgi:hypothetical protein
VAVPLGAVAVPGSAVPVPVVGVATALLLGLLVPLAPLLLPVKTNL